MTIIAAAVAAPVWWFCVSNPAPRVAECATLCGTILFSGLMLSPDLDLDSSIYRRWGPLRFLWWPYQKVMPHRSIFSHSFVVGPLIRLLYFFVLVYGFWRMGSYFVSLALPGFDRNGISQAWTGTLFGLWKTHPHIAYMALTGIFVGTGLHVGADLIVTGLKRRLHKKKRRHHAERRQTRRENRENRERHHE